MDSINPSSRFPQYPARSQEDLFDFDQGFDSRGGAVASPPAAVSRLGRELQSFDVPHGEQPNTEESDHDYPARRDRVSLRGPLYYDERDVEEDAGFCFLPIRDILSPDQSVESVLFRSFSFDLLKHTTFKAAAIYAITKAFFTALNPVATVAVAVSNAVLNAGLILDLYDTLSELFSTEEREWGRGPVNHIARDHFRKTVIQALMVAQPVLQAATMFYFMGMSLPTIALTILVAQVASKGFDIVVDSLRSLESYIVDEERVQRMELAQLRYGAQQTDYEAL